VNYKKILLIIGNSILIISQNALSVEKLVIMAQSVKKKEKKFAQNVFKRITLRKFVQMKFA
jgi:pSer/pThr/pTyr-binding forkhead associated (FHA) protein